jgi:hypothetical protein
MDFFYCSLIVFALTLLITKSKILACKREYVEERYQEAKKLGGGQTGWVHSIWRATWTCPMCSGFWFALILSPRCGLYMVLPLFGTNWLLHCLENALFQIGQYFEKLAKTENLS